MADYKIKSVAVPASLAITRDELKSHLRITGTDQDAVLDTLIDSSIDIVERQTRLYLINRAVVLSYDEWGAGHTLTPWKPGLTVGVIPQSNASEIALPIAPVSSITSITTVDEAGAGTVFDSANWYFLPDETSPRIVLKKGITWPVLDRTAGGIEIAVVAGFGASSSSVPNALLTACKLIAAHGYESRGDDVDNVHSVPDQAMEIINTYRRVTI